MPWIKKNPHLVVLLIVALLVIAGSALAAKSSQSFNEKFAPVQEKVVPGEKIEPLDMSVVEQAQQELQKPATWTANVDQLPPFVPFRYAMNKETGLPARLTTMANFKDPLTGTEIPNTWLLNHRLPVTDPAVVSQDPDNDGFTNADEFRGNTDPQVKDSHPPYHTLLFLKRFLRVPFLLKFNAYDGDPKKPEEMTFQINTLSIRTPSQFLKIGDNVANNKYKIIKFEYKMVNDPSIGGEKELSELTLENNETKATVVLVLNKVIDSPDSFAVFDYIWPKPPIAFQVAKLGKFVLLPNRDPNKDLYQLLDVNDDGAEIKTPDGQTVKVPPYPKTATFPQH